jgi:hypothetical protein
MRLTNSARQEAGLFQNIQTVPLCTLLEWRRIPAGRRGLACVPDVGRNGDYAILLLALCYIMLAMLADAG